MNAAASEWASLLPLFLAFLIGVLGLVAVLSGWRVLARRFPVVGEAEGERFHFASAKMGRVPWFPVNFGGCLILTVGRGGLSLSSYLPFRFFCPAFFLPWAAVESVEDRSTALSRRTMVRIKGSPIWLAIRGAAGQSIAAMFARTRGDEQPR
ncbi:MAG: hypothetical protein ABI920_06785 [Casimicrobiaceae bacterium]